MVCAMRGGQVFVIDIGKLKCNFAQELKSLPWAQIFDFANFREQENHCQIVKQDEMFMIGNQNPGQFMMRKEFQIVILSNAHEPENVKEILTGLSPYMDNIITARLRKSTFAIDSDSN